MLCYEGKISIISYAFTIVSFCIVYFINRCSPLYHAPFLGPALFYIIVNILIKIFSNRKDYEIIVRATFLGFIFALGVYIYLYPQNNIQAFGIYMCVMSFFHYSEYLSIAIIQPSFLSTNSFLISHSTHYIIAAVTSWIEFGVESYLLPAMKTYIIISYIGLVICICGELLRKLAMFTAKSNFNHLVQCIKADDHVLITHGIYAFFRHPSYVGWFYWSIGTQIILLNPICIVGYSLASWFFFNERVMIEEITLLNFFGEDYCNYQNQVGTGLPFIDGYRIKE